MAPKTKAKPAAFDQDLVSSIIQHEEDVWDSSPMRMPGWFAKLCKDIPTADLAFDALLERGYIISRGKSLLRQMPIMLQRCLTIRMALLPM